MDWDRITTDFNNHFENRRLQGGTGVVRPVRTAGMSFSFFLFVLLFGVVVGGEGDVKGTRLRSVPVSFLHFYFSDSPIPHCPSLLRLAPFQTLRSRL